MSLASESEASAAGGGNARYRKAAKSKQHAHAATGEFRREPSTLSRLLRSVGGKGSRNVLAVEGLDSSARMAINIINLLVQVFHKSNKTQCCTSIVFTRAEDSEVQIGEESSQSPRTRSQPAPFERGGSGAGAGAGGWGSALSSGRSSGGFGGGKQPHSSGAGVAKQDSALSSISALKYRTLICHEPPVKL